MSASSVVSFGMSTLPAQDLPGVLDRVRFIEDCATTPRPTAPGTVQAHGLYFGYQMIRKTKQ